MTESRPRLWDYSCELYAKPPVTELCLQLQERYGLDVNLILFCIWYGRYWGQMPDTLLADAVRHCSDWRSAVVQPLRNVRTQMKNDTTLRSRFHGTDYETLRENIKKLELNAEKIQQEALEQLANELASTGNSSDKESSLTNLYRLCEQLKLDRDNSLDASLKSIVQANENLPDGQARPG